MRGEATDRIPVKPCSRSRSYPIITVLWAALAIVGVWHQTASSEPRATSLRDQAAVRRDSTTVVGNGTTGPYWVSGFFIVRESATVWGNDNTRLNPERYALDPNAGRITLTDPLGAADTLRVEFLRLNWAIPSQLTSATIDAPNDPVLVPAAARFDAPLGTLPPRPGGSRRSPSSSQSIRWQGFKSFALNSSTGSDANLTQGLELSVDGELAEGLQLKAALSDRHNSPATDSRYDDATRIGDLDRVFIEAQSERFYGRMGDLTIGGAGSLAPARHASGVRLRWNNPVHEFEGYIGRAHGRVVRQRMNLQPDIAGPYELIPNAGDRGRVIPGSVVLWLDGRRLTEGIASDYTFDAIQNTVTFDPSIVPDAQSLAIAEFEQALDDYQRTMGAARWSWRRDQQFSHGTRIQWEADDPDRPLFATPTDAQREALAGSPDGGVRVPSAQYSGNHEGDYSRDINTDGDTVFAYVGPGNGDWRVRFEYVGHGNGRYRHLAETAYEYVGSGNGSYEPTLTLSAPSASLAVVETVALDTRSAGRWEAQWLGRADTPNRLATNSTRFTSDHRLSWALGAESATHGAGDGVAIDWRRQGRAAAAFDRNLNTLQRFADLWGLSTRHFDSSWNEYSVRTQLSRNRRVGTSIESGIFSSSVLDAWRINSVSQVRFIESLTGVMELDHRAARENSLAGRGNGSRRRIETRLTQKTRLADATIGWNEHRLENTAYLFEPEPEYASARWVSLSRSGALASYRWETTDDSAMVRGGSRRTREASLQVPLGVHRTLDGRFIAARGEETRHDDTWTPYYRGRLNAHWRPDPTTTITLDLQLLHARGGAQREAYLPTRPGQGQYRLERGEYIPDAHGDYRRVISQPDEYNQTAYDGRQQFALHWNPQLAGLKWSLESRHERLGRHDPNTFRPGIWLLPWTSADWMLGPGARGERHDFHRLTVRPAQGAQLAIEWAEDLTLFGGENNRNSRERLGLSGRYDPARTWFVQGAFDNEDRDRQREFLSAVQAHAQIWRLTFGGTAARKINWSMEGRLRRERERTQEQLVRLLGLRPRIQASVGPLSLLLELDGSWVKNDMEWISLSPLLAEGRPEGASVKEFSELRWELPGRVTLRSRLIGDLRRDAPDRWRWELETTARF